MGNGWHGLTAAVRGNLRRMPPLTMLLAATVLAGCSERRSENPAPVSSRQPSANSPTPSMVRPAPPSPPVDASAPQSEARSIEDYKRDVARWIYRRSAEDVFEGAPPAMLKSVVVLEIAVDATGHVRRTAVRRDNGYAELSRLALRSVGRSAPLPRPSRSLMRGGSLEFNETWLFREDGKFQIRSIALPQAPPA